MFPPYPPFETLNKHSLSTKTIPLFTGASTVSLPLPTDHFHARHDGAGRVGAVCGDRDEADVAVRVAVGFVVATDGQETCELAVCA